MTQPPLLRIDNLHKRFGGTVALDGAEIEVAPGEVHALVGQNGAGKSTLIKILTGFIPGDDGEITFEGAPFSVGSPQAAQAAGISTIYQEINLVPTLSVTENICLGREIRRRGLLDWRGMRAEAERLLAKFNMSIDVSRPLSDFSTATQQMIAIARAIGFSARLVIMDEPTSSLDEREAAVLFDVIRGLRDEGVSVIFVSHKLDELYEVCDRVTIMRDGRTIRACAMAEIGKLDLVSTMLGREISRSGGRTTAFAGDHDHDVGDTILSAEGLKDGAHVRDVHFSVRKGEIVGFAGLLGAGRTETAKLVFGAARPEGGEIRFDGAGFAPQTPADAINAGIGFCTEDRKVEGIVPDMSIAENMMLALMPKLARAGILDEKRQARIVEKFIASLGIKCAGPGQKIRELSGGNQQKVLLGRWLAMSPRLLILDEPTRGIDVGAKAEIQKLVNTLADDGLAVLMISSELEEVSEGADRVFVLREGLTVAELTNGEINEERILAAMAHGGGEPSVAEA
ncbi:sugar ABC transporter ATP-binding protein [Oceanomicrobium pacificus]|uniref:ATP-binding cassette domain-containing protein n=1 Tax=Oceanomicrobium pacificus TaxID=2692916 RepID=A0A6B0TTB6_9RHOB|nr:sugar ABC transporter ATP-binding protein [Oceanomicrobium pacificus]MXU66019.1 ATP-binding cassette domain-containing protein [Oceanomicrobium pacificus]